MGGYGENIGWISGAKIGLIGATCCDAGFLHNGIVKFRSRFVRRCVRALRCVLRYLSAKEVVFLCYCLQIWNTWHRIVYVEMSCK